MLLAEKQKTIVEELSLIPDAYERLGYLVEYGKNLSKLEPVSYTHLTLPTSYAV